MSATRGQPEGMETLQQAVARLERRGFTAALRSWPGGRIGTRDESCPAADAVVEEIVRFEGQSDPEDQAVLFAIRAPDDAWRGTFVAAYGPRMDPDTVEVVDALNASQEDRRAPGRHARA